MPRGSKNTHGLGSHARAAASKLAEGIVDETTPLPPLLNASHLGTSIAAAPPTNLSRTSNLSSAPTPKAALMTEFNSSCHDDSKSDEGSIARKRGGIMFLKIQRSPKS